MGDRGWGLRPLLTSRSPLGSIVIWVGSALRADLVFLAWGVALPRPPKAECKAKPSSHLSSPCGEKAQLSITLCIHYLDVHSDVWA